MRTSDVPRLLSKGAVAVAAAPAPPAGGRRAGTGARSLFPPPAEESKTEETPGIKSVLTRERTHTENSWSETPYTDGKTTGTTRRGTPGSRLFP